MEAARDGLDYAAVEQRGYEILYPADVLEQVPRLVGSIELEALFADGNRLIVLHDPITSGGPPSLDAGNAEPQWLEGGTPLQLANRSDVPIALTSHFHVFEANRRLLLDRRAAWGMRLAVAAGAKVLIEPGQTREVRVVPFGGARIVRGHGGLVDGPLGRAGRAGSGTGAGAGAGLRGCLTGRGQARRQRPLARARGRRVRRTRPDPRRLGQHDARRPRRPRRARRRRGGDRRRAASLDPVLGRARRSIGIAARARRRGRPGGEPGHDGRHRGRARHRHGGDRRDRADRHARRRSTRTCTGSRRRSATRRWPAGSPRW